MSERVVVTGANRGLGLELVRHYAARGDDVWAGCRRPAAADELGELTDHVLTLDVGSEDSIKQFAVAVGDAPVDVLINNAGVDGRALGVPDDERDVLQLSPEHVLDEIRINAIGPMLLTRALLDPLRKSSRPRIVNMSSTVGSMEVAATVGRDVGYVTSKAALNMITVKLAGRLRDDGVIAVALHPGLLRTAIATPQRRARGPRTRRGRDRRARRLTHTGAVGLVPPPRRIGPPLVDASYVPTVPPPILRIATVADRGRPAGSKSGQLLTARGFDRRGRAPGSCRLPGVLDVDEERLPVRCRHDPGELAPTRPDGEAPELARARVGRDQGVVADAVVAATGQVLRRVGHVGPDPQPAVPVEVEAVRGTEDVLLGELHRRVVLRVAGEHEHVPLEPRARSCRRCAPAT